MARLHEHQGKTILAANGFTVPRGRPAGTADDAVLAAKEILDKSDGEVVIKIQAWTTGRAAMGGVAFAKELEEVHAHAARMLSMKVGQFPVEAVLVAEKIDIEREFFLSFAIDDAARALAPPRLRPRPQAVQASAPHAAAPLEPPGTVHMSLLAR